MPNNPDKKITNEYLMNKKTIGGVDDTKDDQIQKKKIYIGLPSNKFSKITLALIVIATFGFIGFYVYQYIQTKNKKEEIVQQAQNGNLNVIEQPVKVDINEPVLTTRQKITRITAPFDIQSDEFIISAQKFDIKDNAAILEFLSKDKYEVLNKELIEYKKILDEDTKTDDNK